LPGAQVAVGDFGLTEEFVESFHGMTLLPTPQRWQ